MWLVAIFVCLGWIVSVCLHEFGHAVVAYLGGDTSVKDKGYLTLNPLKYTHPTFSLLLPILFLVMGGIALPGGAVYIDWRRLRNRWWQSAVSAAGPLASVLATLLLTIPFWLGWPAQSPGNWIWPSLAFLIVLEIASVLLNLLPIPPLDGYGIIEPWLSQKAQIQFNKIGEYGVWVIFGLLWFVQPLNQFFWDSTYRITETLGVPPEMAGIGYALFRKQSNILILGLVGVLWLFRRKEIKWYNQGNKLRKLQRYEEAIASYERAIEIKSDYYEAWYYRSYLLYKLQRYEEAITSYDKVIQLNPEEADAWYNRGLILETLQKPEGALASYDKVIEIRSDFYQAWYTRGIALEKLQQYEEAIASFDRAIQIQSDFPYAWYNKACCYALQGNVPLAIETLQQAINLDPDQFREQAKTDSSFDTIQENQLFKNLIGE